MSSSHLKGLDSPADLGSGEDPVMAAAKRDVRVAVCVATYRRPEGLLRLLHALEAQEAIGGAVEVAVVVVDNDVSGSARAICREAAAWLPLPLRYAVEKRRGIPQARNAALDAAGDADFVAFIDDDVTPEPGWLASLLAMQSRTDADVVTGPCLACFVEPPAPWLADGGFFDGPRHDDGTRLATAYTHNVLVRGALVAAGAARFDERFALTGGEDSELFGRLARDGARIVFCADAVVHEWVPTSRARASWILRRAFRTGAAGTWVEASRGAGSIAAIAGHGLRCLAKAGIQLLSGVFTGRAEALHALRLGCYGAGRIFGLLGIRLREYRHIHGR
jgi:glycosyltransferase involved in cell wall biosynthesis